jgi:hypothetical protein
MSDDDDGDTGGISDAAITLNASKSEGISGPRVLISVANPAETVFRVRFRQDKAPRIEGFKLNKKSSRSETSIGPIEIYLKGKSPNITMMFHNSPD